MTDITFNCIKCEKVFANFSNHDEYMFTYDAVELTTRGNFGSTVFDGGPKLNCYLCDECFTAIGNKGFLIRTNEVKNVTYDYKRFNLDDYLKYGK